jgi:steroid 5-alpha reductase family enzyme
MNSTFGTGALVIAVAMTLLWLWSLKKRDASIIDAFWGPGFAILAWVHVLENGMASSRGILVAALTSVWALRLGWHIARRSVGKAEDYRYAAMRAHWGEKFWWVSFFTVFMLQAALMLAIAAPLYAAAESSAALGLIDALGIALFLAGFACEAVADWQLRRFVASPQNRGRTLQTGLWRYSRHPNYFGDALLWWGLFLIGGLATGHLWLVFSPIIMTVLLRRISGVPLTEKRMRQRRPDFESYAKRTNTFIPWFPGCAETEIQHEVTAS